MLARSTCSHVIYTHIYHVFSYMLATHSPHYICTHISCSSLYDRSTFSPVIYTHISWFFFLNASYTFSPIIYAHIYNVVLYMTGPNYHLLYMHQYIMHLLTSKLHIITHYIYTHVSDTFIHT